MRYLVKELLDNTAGDWLVNCNESHPDQTFREDTDKHFDKTKITFNMKHMNK